MILIKKIKQDFNNNSFKRFVTILFYRILNFHYINKNKILLNITFMFYSIIKSVLSLQSQISYKATIGKNIRLPHKAFGVIISAKALIGDNVTIFHLVTIGINEKKCNMLDKFCVEIGNNCYISCGAKIISSKLYDDVIIGPNSVVYKDVFKGQIVLNKVKYLR